MSVLGWLRSVFAPPARIDDGGDPEAAADLHEEFGAPDEGAADIKQMAATGGPGGYVPAEEFAAAESAETAEDDLETEEAPPDPDP